MMGPLEELAVILRPAGAGLHLVSTGKAAQQALQQRLYGVSDSTRVSDAFRDRLSALASARAVVLGVPSDNGAGFRRGANLGPQVLREALLEGDPDWAVRSADVGIVDVGDVFVVPQLLHDEMLSDAQLERSRMALYPHVSPALRDALPVSPLSIQERALNLMFTVNPSIVPVVLGGDHSVAWPVASALHGVQRLHGIVQFDAHTDLLAERLGVPYCFATWTYHANRLLGGDEKILQLGIRASGHERGHWEQSLGVRQLWAEACRTSPDEALNTVIAHVRKIGRPVYLSNDIDGTDAYWASATGTPESDGLEPEFVETVIRAVAQEVGFAAADLVEVAPPLATPPGGLARTIEASVRYLHATFDGILAGPSPAR